MPLNGRQFANLAATVPGVGLSFHSDPTKSTQYAPLVNGGAGRNINYQIDGGDNNDDTVGGQLAGVPARSDRAVQLPDAALQGRVRPQQRRRPERRHQERHEPAGRGSAFEFFRDKSMNALTETEILAAPAPARRSRATIARTSSAAASAVRSLKDKAHFFVAVERTKQDKTQAVNTQGLFPSQDGVFAVPYRETPFTGKVTANLNAEPVPVGALRPQHTTRSRTTPRRTARSTTGATARTSTTRST